MKKKFYFATLVIAALSFTGCANDEYVGDQRNPGEQNGAIAFSTKSTNTVRANSEVPTAADKLHGQFWVYGWKEKTSTDGEGTTTITESALVFNNYKVDYRDATISPSITKVWEYVGEGQTIKYWDYSYDQYEFEAYSYKSEAGGSVTRKGNALEAGYYEVKQLSETEYANLYFAQKEKKPKPATGTKYDDVQLKFKSVLSKIRVGFYETIPGYSVKITAFYLPSGEDPADFDADHKSTSAFVAWCPNKAAKPAHPFVVEYVNDGTPAVTQVANSETGPYDAIAGTATRYKLDPTLTLGGNLISLISNGTETPAVTWDKTDGIYTYFIPQNQLGEGEVKEMKIKVDYTLTSDDTSGEEIHVKGATAIVPKEYLQWEPNTAYSYVFKISDNTNGSTGTPGIDPAGLYPITFDAVVTEMEKNDYLTTVSDLSITATQGKQFAEADKAAFNTDQEIKVKVMRYDDHGAASDITYLFTSNQTDYQFSAAFVSGKTYDYNKSQEDNLNGQTLDSKNPADGNNYITLEGKSAGFWIVQVTYKAGNETIIKYAVLKVGTETQSTPGNGEGGE